MAKTVELSQIGQEHELTADIHKSVRGEALLTPIHCAATVLGLTR